MFRPNGSVAMSSRTWSSQLLNIYEPIRSWDDIKHEFLLVNVCDYNSPLHFFFSFRSKSFSDMMTIMMLQKQLCWSKMTPLRNIWNVTKFETNCTPMTKTNNCPFLLLRIVVPKTFWQECQYGASSSLLPIFEKWHFISEFDLVPVTTMTMMIVENYLKKSRLLIRLNEFEKWQR